MSEEIVNPERTYHWTARNNYRVLVGEGYSKTLLGAVRKGRACVEQTCFNGEGYLVIEEVGKACISYRAMYQPVREDFRGVSTGYRWKTTWSI